MVGSIELSSSSSNQTLEIKDMAESNTCAEVVMESSTPPVETAMEKSQGMDVSTSLCAGIEKLRIGDYNSLPLETGAEGFGIFCLRTDTGGFIYEEAYLRTILADELQAEKRKATVLELFHSAPDTYDFLLQDYITRALHPVCMILIDFLNRFDVWSYELARFVYVAMRDARRSLVVPVPEFTEIFELAEYIVFKVESGDVNETEMSVINTKIAELRETIKKWVHATDF